MTTRDVPAPAAGIASTGRPVGAGSLPAGGVEVGKPMRPPAGTVNGSQRGAQGRTGTRQAIAAAMSEAELERRVRKLMKDLGLLSYHTFRSDKSPKGYPDFTITGTRVLFRELKTERGRVTAEQRVWLAALRDAGCDVAVWLPSDLVSGRVAAELAAISKFRRAA